MDINNVQSYFKRKRIAIEDVLNSNAPTLSDLVCETPATSPRPISQRTAGFPSPLPDSDIFSKMQSLAVRVDPQQLESPDSFKTAELLFADIRQYVLVSFGTGCWISLGPDTYCQSKRASFTEDESLDLYYLFSEKRPADAVQRKLFKEFEHIESAVEAQSVMILPYLIRLIAILLELKLKPIVLMLCRQLCFMASIVGSREDWVNFFFKSIFSRIRALAQNDEANDYLLAALRSSIDSHEKVLGPFHLQTLRTTSMLTHVTTILHGSSGIMGPLMGLYGSLERQQGPGTVQSLRVLHDLVNIYIDSNQLQAAETAAQKAIDQGTLLIQSSRSNIKVSLLCAAYVKIFYAQALQNNLSQAMINLRNARDLIGNVGYAKNCSALFSLLLPREHEMIFEIIKEFRDDYQRRRLSIRIIHDT